MYTKCRALLRPCGIVAICCVVSHFSLRHIFLRDAVTNLLRHPFIGRGAESSISQPWTTIKPNVAWTVPGFPFGYDYRLGHQRLPCDILYIYTRRCESSPRGMAEGHFARRPNQYAEDMVVNTPYNSLVDINELSRRLSVPKGTLYNWCYLRRIPFIKAGADSGACE